MLTNACFVSYVFGAYFAFMIIKWFTKIFDKANILKTMQMGMQQIQVGFVIDR